MNDSHISRVDLLKYSFIALPLSFAGLPLYMHIPDFYAREFGVGLAALGVCLLCIRFLDAIQDPLIGYIADRNQDKIFTILLGGLVFLTMGLGGLFIGPMFSVLGIAWFAFFMILATTGFSIVTILINMIGGFWKNTDDQRTRISSWREALGLVGLLLAALLPAILQREFSSQHSFEIVFCVYAFLIVLSGFLFKRFMQKNPFKPRAKERTRVSLKHVFHAFKGRNKLFFCVSFLSYLSASIPAVLVLFFIRDYLNAEQMTGAFLALYFVSGACFMGAWIKLSQRYNVYKIWFFSMLLSVVTFAGAVFLNSGDIIAFGVICVLSGIALGADLALPPALLAGRIERDEQETLANQYYAILGLLPKISMAIASGSALLLLDVFGFEAGTSNGDTALMALLLAYTAAPCMVKLLSAAGLWVLIQQEGNNNETSIERSPHYGSTHIS